MKQPIPFVGQSYSMPSLNIDAQNCINWYVTHDQTGKYPTALLPCPGLKVFRAGDTEKIVRGMYVLNNKLYAMIDDILYKINQNGQSESLGTFPTSIGNVRFVANDWQLMMSDGVAAYIYQIKDSDPDAKVSRTKGDFFQITAASSNIGDVTFTGTGISDMTTGGTYSGDSDKSYIVIIQSAATPDTFKWSDDNGATYTQDVTVTGNAQTLSNGITITFTNTTGHTKDDRWDFDITVDDIFYVPLIPTTIDSYGIFPRQNSNIWYISDDNPYDFSQINTLQFARAAAFPDDLVATVAIREELWLICEQTTEIWYDTGASPFPFERRENVLVNYGCEAPYSLAVADNNILFWLANNENGDRVIVMNTAYEPQIVSTEPINRAIRGYSKVDDAIGFSYQWEGHIFYTIIFPTADRTWEFDVTTKSWHERRSTLTNVDPATSDTRQGRWIANCYANFAGKRLVGDFQSGNIYELSSETYDENGTRLICERTGQHLQSNLNRLFCNSFQIDVQAATGLVSGQGSDPQLMLTVSRDGGHHFGNERWRSAGKVGEYRHRAKWNRLGQARNFTFRLRISDPVYRVVLGAVADMEATSV